VDVQLTAVDARSGRSADVVLVVEKDSTVADAARALRAALGLPDSVEGYVDGYGPTSPSGTDVWIAGRPVEPSLPMTVSPLREGAVVGLGGPVGLGVHDPDVGGVAEVRVVGGPDAGRVHRLPLGEFVLGAAHDAEAYVADGSVAARQARLQVTPQEVRWTPYDGATPATIEGRPLTEPRALRPGQVVAVGTSRFTVVPAEAPDAAASGAGQRHRGDARRAGRRAAPTDPAAGVAGAGAARRGHVPDHQVTDVPAVHAAQPGADAEQLADRAQAGQAVLPPTARRLQA
jgi:S-DNA-T family DNA segregation ATPase FtsK/SpoIIIE